MPPTVKDLDVTNPSLSTPGVRPASVGAPEDNAGKPQPVPLEVPVTVNGARTVEGSDKREPFSETTQTVLVFGNGAVIRLASSVASGQLLFLTNEKTKKEVVCQVVKSKNYKNVSGYVELEFTEAVPGFWGMRFPGDHAAAQPKTPAPAAIAKPVAPAPVAAKVEAPAMSAIPQRVDSKVAPALSATITTSARNIESNPSVNFQQATESKSATILPSLVSPNQVAQQSVKPIGTTNHAALPKAPGLTDGFGAGLTSTARPVESKAPAPVAPKASQTLVVTPNSSDALRRESERLQEQLASMLFAAEVPAIPVQTAPAPPPVQKQSSTVLPAKVVEIAKLQTPAAKVTLKTTPVQSHFALDDEEVKIPSWLEPLARNAANPGQNENIAKAEPASANKVIEFEVQDVSAPPVAEVEETSAPTQESRGIHIEDTSPIRVQDPAQGKNKGLLIGAIAAGLLVAAAGGTWYARQSSAPSQQVTATAPAAALTPAADQATPRGADKTTARNVSEAPAPNRSNINSEPVAKAPSQTPPSPVNSQTGTPDAQLVKISPDKNTAAELSAYKKLAEPAFQPSTKKSTLGQVHLSAPKAGRALAPDFENADDGLALSGGQVVPSGDSLTGGGLVTGNSKQPAAPTIPLPIGGDVKSARLLFSPPPTYPTLAKTQRIQGAVLVDALVDTSGRISSMKVVSGPPLLHQAAMDSLRQWKYQPATLDGKAVPMHLTVTIQFHLQ
jgi:TonB family protein